MIVSMPNTCFWFTHDDISMISDYVCVELIFIKFFFDVSKDIDSYMFLVYVSFCF